MKRRGFGNRMLPALAFVALMLCTSGARAAAPVTYGSDALRTGWYPDQPSLHPQLVSGGTFGQLFATPVDGQVYAQPLVSNGTLFVATETNWIYGLDPRTGAVRWSRNVGPAFDPTVPPISCGDVAPRVGVTGTPVIDPDTGTAYFFAKTYASGSSGPAAYEAHAVDVSSGAERDGFPVRIDGPAQNQPATPFDATHELQRPALLLMDGVVYAAFGGHCDRAPYQGWVVGVSTAGEVRAKWVDLDSQLHAGAGIWQSGGGLVSDGPGRIMLSTGNGFSGSGGSPAPPTAGSNPPASLGQSVVRLQVQPGGTLSTADFFAPYDAAELDTWDADVGSGSPVALPDSFGTPAHPHVLVQMTKGGYVYLLDRDHLGGAGMGPNGGDDAIKRSGPYGGVWSRPAVWPGDGGYVYAPTASSSDTPGGSSGVLRVYRSGVDGDGNPSLALVATSADAFNFGSGAPVVTSDGQAPGSALVWLLRAGGFGGSGAELRAYAAVPVAGRPQLVWSAPVGNATKFSAPGVAAGRVYVGTAGGRVIGFGSPVEPVLAASSVSFPGVVTGQQEERTATLHALQPVTVTGLSTTNSQFSAGTPSQALPATLAAGDELTVPVTFAPTSAGAKGATLAVATGGTQASVGLSGSGVDPSPQLVLDPPALSFGGTRAGGHLTGTATIANAGGAPLTIDAVESPSAPFSIGGAPAPGTVLAPGESVVVDVHFDPEDLGRYADELNVETSGGDEVVGVSGTAGNPPLLEISRDAVDFGDVTLGGSAARYFTVGNAGTSSLTITKSKPPTGAQFSVVTPLPEGTTLFRGQSLTIRVDFNPLAIGPDSGSWTITGNDGYGSHVVSFSGSGAELPPPDGPLEEIGQRVFPPLAGPSLTRLRVLPSRFAARRPARASYALTRAASVRLQVARLTRRGYRRAGAAWTVRGALGTNRVLLPARFRTRPGRYRLIVTPAGGTPRNAAFRVTGR